MKRLTKFVISLFLLAGVLSACALPGLFTPSEQTDEPQQPGVSQPTANLSRLNTPQLIIEEKVYLASENPTYEIELVYPILDSNPAVAVPFNHQIELLVDTVRESFMQNVEEQAQQGTGSDQQATSTLSMAYDVLYNNNGILSVHLSVTSYIAISAHPYTNSFAFNYDLEMAEFLLMEDLFSQEADYLSVILPQVEQALTERSFGYQVGTAEVVIHQRENWNIVPEGLRVNFDAYEVGPGAAGPQFVVVPWEDLSTVLGSESPLRGLIAP
jgi:hypothetical protein